ncbi:hypothetical protein AXF42_Ash016014 [Apostasia shenzhenica]|uniref:DUF4216 domain-containing protein n=1 Tax=Apostasia shenzhenica TaxID=1088818 RepID=A0A2I0AWR2_9ASPA|nr:hypothetical protein AXF42_Ash016014 [Apostasia shenzhenica]
MLTEIIALEYFGRGNKVVLFRCDWYDTVKGTRIDPNYGFVDVNHRSRLKCNSYESFILAQQATQVYYTTYPSTKKEAQNWWVVCKTKSTKIIELDYCQHTYDVLQEDDQSFSLEIIIPLETHEQSVMVRSDPPEEVESNELSSFDKIGAKRKANVYEKNVIVECIESEEEDEFNSEASNDTFSEEEYSESE